MSTAVSRIPDIALAVDLILPLPLNGDDQRCLAQVYAAEGGIVPVDRLTS